MKTTFNGTLKLDFPTLTPDKNGNPVVWYVVHKNAYSGMIQNETPIEENERVVFDFQSIENDTTSIKFKNAIYPNPFQKSITVNSLEDDVFIIKSLDGKIINKQSVSKGSNKIVLKHLSKGIYFGELEKQKYVTKLERL
jgi:hypothetical protein